MHSRNVFAAGVAAVALALGGASAAAASVISYTVSGLFTGSYDFAGQPSVSFTDAPIQITAYCDTSTAFTATDCTVVDGAGLIR